MLLVASWLRIGFGLSAQTRHRHVVRWRFLSFSLPRGRRPGRAPVVRGGAFEGSVSRRHVDGHDTLVAMAPSHAQRLTAIPLGWLEDVPERPLQLWLHGGARLVLVSEVRPVPSNTWARPPGYTKPAELLATLCTDPCRCQCTRRFSQPAERAPPSLCARASCERLTGASQGSYERP